MATKKKNKKVDFTNALYGTIDGIDEIIRNDQARTAQQRADNLYKSVAERNDSAKSSYNEYANRVSNGEYITEDEMKTYKSAVGNMRRFNQMNQFRAMKNDPKNYSANNSKAYDLALSKVMEDMDNTSNALRDYWVQDKISGNKKKPGTAGREKYESEYADYKDYQQFREQLGNYGLDEKSTMGDVDAQIKATEQTIAGAKRRGKDTKDLETKLAELYKLKETPYFVNTMTTDELKAKSEENVEISPEEKENLVKLAVFYGGEYEDYLMDLDEGTAARELEKVRAKYGDNFANRIASGDINFAEKGTVSDVAYYGEDGEANTWDKLYKQSYLNDLFDKANSTTINIDGRTIPLSTVLTFMTEGYYTDANGRTQTMLHEDSYNSGDIQFLEEKYGQSPEIGSTNAINELRDKIKNQMGIDVMEYMFELKRRSDEDFQNKRDQWWLDETSKGGFEGALARVGGMGVGAVANLVGAADYPADLVESAMHNGHVALPNTANDAGTNLSSVIKQGGSQYYTEKFGNELAGQTYSGLSSAIDSALITSLSMGVFGNTLAGKLVTDVVMGSTAASNSFADAYKNGSSEDEALIYGFMSGVNEGLGEHLSLDLIFDKIMAGEISKQGFKKILDYAARMGLSGFTEGSEEVFTNFLNRGADALINQDHSAWNARVDQLVREGMSAEEAKEKVLLENLWEDIWSAYGGAIGGLGHSVVAGVVNKAGGDLYTRKEDTQLGKDLTKMTNGKTGADAAMAFVENAKAQSGLSDEEFATAVPAAKDVTDAKTDAKGNIKNSTYRAVAKVADQTSKIIADQSKTAIKSEITKALNDAGVKNAEKVADSVYNLLADEANDNDRAVVHNDSAVEDVYNSIKNNKNTAILLEKTKTHARQQSLVTGKTQENDFEDVLTKVQNKLSAEEGKAMYYANGLESGEGETVDITGIDSITKVKDEEGNVTTKATYKLSDGRTVDSNNVTYADEDQALLYETAVKMGVNADEANALIAGFKASSQTNASFYMMGAMQAYSYGRLGVSQDNIKGGFFSELTKAERDFAYNLGVEARNETDKRSVELSKSRKKASEKGRIVFHTDTKYNDMDSRRKTSISYLARLISRDINTTIHFYESVEEGGKRVVKDKEVYDKLVETGHDMEKSVPNGFYDVNNGEIYIDINAGEYGEGAILYTASHELTHYIRGWNAKKFITLRDTVFNEYAKRGIDVDALVRRRAEAEGLSYDDAAEEVLADAMSKMLTTNEFANAMDTLRQQDAKLWEKIKQFFKDLLTRIQKEYKNLKPNSYEGRAFSALKDKVQDIANIFAEGVTETGVERSADVEALNEVGIDIDEATGTAMIVDSARFAPQNAKERQEAIDRLSKQLDLDKETVAKWVDDEMSIASMVLDPKFNAYLDYEADPFDPTHSIKDDSDYPQGTLDFSNICRKRREYTRLMERVQRAFPNKVFTADDYAKIRNILIDEDIEVACGLCYVEDRRQLDSKIANSFIGMIKSYKEGNHEYFIDASNHKKEFSAKQRSIVEAAVKNGYEPNIYELTTLAGSNELKESNKEMYDLWESFNNARGMASARLLLNETEYDRQLLKLTKRQVNSKNKVGGLRIYSFSDFEEFHLLDIMQAIQDCAAMGLKVQFYTKVPQFAALMRGTGAKGNRSLIPAGDLGYHMENGKVVLDYDTKEGIDINSKYFFDSSDDPDIGNILVGINDTQIRAAMVSDFIDYIIPFHTNQANRIIEIKGLKAWDNYKDSQNEMVYNEEGKLVKAEYHINIYTDVLEAAEKEGKPIKTEREFCEKFLAVCAEKGLVPRFQQFLNRGENGEYIYTKGYAKLLLDFKLFDRDGNILPQNVVHDSVNAELATEILKEYVQSEKTKETELPEKLQKAYDRIENEIVKAKDSSRNQENPALKTLNGSTIQRSKFGVGKQVGSQVYVHKNYASDVIPADVWEKAQSMLPSDFKYNTVMYDLKSPDTVRFDEAPDFDTAREPRTGKMKFVDTATGEVRDGKGNQNYIWHHKWEWVKNDYKGFDVQESYNWSKQWLQYISNPSGSLPVWNKALTEKGLPTDSSAVKHSLRVVDPVKPTSNEWQSGHSEEWFKENGFPVREDVSEEWLEARKAKGWTEGKKDFKDKGLNGNSKKVGTQIASTIATYNAIYDYLEKTYPDTWKNMRILDASSGLGLGTKAGLLRGFDVTDIEPYVHPDSDYMPDYMDYSSLQSLVESGEVKPFDFIISNAVLNVIPQDTRDNMVKWFGSVLAENGQLYVNTLGSGYTKDATSTKQYDAKGKLTGQTLTQKGENKAGNEVFVGGSSMSVQKGFSNTELRAYLQDALGDEFAVTPSKIKAGIATAMATKKAPASGAKFAKRGINKYGIEVYETSEEIKNMTWSERVKTFNDLLREEYVGRTARFKRNGHIYYAELDRSNPTKSLFGEKKSSSEGKKAYIREGADGSFFDIVENSTYTNSEIDRKPHKKRDNFTEYFDYFYKTVQINNKVFDVYIDVKKKKGAFGGYTYDVRLHDNKTIEASPAIATKESGTKSVGDTSYNNPTTPSTESQPSSKNSSRNNSYAPSHVATAEDTRYLEALKNNDEVTMREIISNIATMRGFIERVLHGTKKEGFTQIDTSKSDDKLSFFVTNSLETAKTYSSTDKIKKLSEINEEMRLFAKRQDLSDRTYKDYNDYFNSKVMDALANRLLQKEYYNSSTLFANFYEDGTTEETEAFLKNEIGIELTDEERRYINDAHEKNIALLNEIAELDKHIDKLNEEYYDRLDELSNEIDDATRDYAHSLSVQAGYQGWADGKTIRRGVFEIIESWHSTEEHLYESLRDFLEGYAFDLYYDTHEGTQDELVEQQDEWMEGEGEKLFEAVEGIVATAVNYATHKNAQTAPVEGNYEMYLNPHNLMVVEGNGRNWNDLEDPNLPDLNDPKIAKRYRWRGNRWTTRNVARLAKDLGYNGVLFKDILDHGGQVRDNISPANVYAIFNTAVQLKSADLVTYDDDGYVIPPSKRFDTNVNELRFSKRDVSNVTDDELKKLEQHFGVTGNFNVAGYLLTDGKILDFSGKHWGDTVSRTRQVDHRDVQEILERGNNGIDDMVDMIGSGNIRLMPEVGGINLAVYPNEKQRRVLSTYINYMLNTEGEVTIDYDEVGGDTVYSRTYTKGSSSKQILSDIRNYFNGARPSDLMQFHFSSRGMSDTEVLEQALQKLRNSDSYQSRVSEYIQQDQLLTDLMAELDAMEYVRKTQDNIAGNSEINSAIAEIKKDITKAKNRKEVLDNILERKELNAALAKLQGRPEYKKFIREQREAMYKDNVEKIKRAREEEKAKAYEQMAEIKQNFKDIKEHQKQRRTNTELRHRIAKLARNFEKRLLKGTDATFIPKKLVGAVIDICNELDPTGDNQNTKRADKWFDGRQALLELKSVYDNIETSEDYDFSSEFDAEFSRMIGELADKVGGVPLRAMTNEQLEDVYNITSDIFNMVRDATHQIGTAERISNYDAGVNIMNLMAELKEKKIGANTVANWFRNWMENPMRAAREMSGFRQSNDLFRLFKELNEGMRKANIFEMEATKPFDALRANKNAKVFNNSVEKYYDFGLKDEEGDDLKITKQQAMQIILTWERQLANENEAHLVTPVKITDAKLESKGKTVEARDNGQRLMVTDDVIKTLYSKMTEWDKQFMDAARYFFRVQSANAVNETTIITKHRPVATEKNYIPYVTDKNYVEKKNENVKFDASINERGILKSLKKNATQPLIIRGLNNTIDDHIKNVAEIYGFSIPVRNWDKVINVKEVGMSNSVRSAITDTWGSKSLNTLEQAVADIEGSRRGDSLPALSFVKSGFVTSTLAGNLSVWIKQAASYPTAMAYLSPASLTAGLARYNVGNIHLTNKQKQKIYDEIDAHTAAHWRRRKGYSMQELGDFAQSKGLQNRVNRALKDASPYNWIQNMDMATTAALWYACKTEVEMKNKGIKKGSEDYWNKVTELYNTVIEETQPMYDSLHRAEVTKNNISKNFIMFQTQPLQNAGILRESIMEAHMANKFKDRAAQKQAAKKVTMAITSQLLSDLVFTAMTALAKGFLHRVNPYRDDDEEITAESFFSQFGEDFATTAMNVVFPVVFTYAKGAYDAVANYGFGSSNVFSEPMFDKLNGSIDILGKFTKIIKDGDTPTWEDYLSVVNEFASYAGIPSGNLTNIVNGVRLHVEDAMNGEFLSFESGVERENKQNLNLAYKYWNSDRKKAKEYLSDCTFNGTSSITKYFKGMYLKAYKEKDEGTMKTIRQIMHSTKAYKKDVSEVAQGWVKDSKKNKKK